ncbi:MAG: hypothetical protein WBR26_15785 [Candidatus Acidiferrum sp.]
MDTRQLNAVYSSFQMKRRYEVWFLRCGLADGTGAWWFRYLVMNLRRNGCTPDGSCSSGFTPLSGSGCSLPVQIWATWFPRQGKPQTFIQGYPADALTLSARRQLPFHFRIAENGIEENTCWGDLHVDGHAISWKLRYRSDFGVVLSDKGWIGFSQSPHSNAQFSGEIICDGAKFSGDPLGYGVQGHNCGYRHRSYWRWMHAYFPNPQGAASTLEALVYDMPFGLVFRKAVWWHVGRPVVLKRFREIEVGREPSRLKWKFIGIDDAGSPVEASIEASAPGIHVLPYLKTDCSGTFPVSNSSFANATVRFGNNRAETLETIGGAVLEFGGA